MPKRKRGERIWEGQNEYILPPNIDLEQLHRAETQSSDIITVCNCEFIRAADGRLELVGKIENEDY